MDAGAAPSPGRNANLRSPCPRLRAIEEEPTPSFGTAPSVCFWAPRAPELCSEIDSAQAEELKRQATTKIGKRCDIGDLSVYSGFRLSSRPFSRPSAACVNSANKVDKVR
jgi:hypothetical protein